MTEDVCPKCGAADTVTLHVEHRWLTARVGIPVTRFRSCSRCHTSWGYWSMGWLQRAWLAYRRRA